MLQVTEEARRRAKELMEFIDGAPTAFQAAEEEQKRLAAEGFQPLAMGERWTLEPGCCYTVLFGDATLFAFRLADGDGAASAGFRLIGAHNDSPGFQVKSHPFITRAGYVQFNVEPYGGVILRTWLDRPLSLAGRVILRDASAPGGVRSQNVRIERPILIIPSLAIHMDRDVNREGAIQPQQMMLPILMMEDQGEQPDLFGLVAAECGLNADEILDADLFLYATEKGELIGANQEWISSGRLDNLAMAHAATMALLEASSGKNHQLIALHDHEEIGSSTRRGAASSTLMQLLRRISRALGGDAEDFDIALSRSFMVSCDAAHAVHPNHLQVADPTNRPLLNGGPVLKYAAAKSYITDGEGGARARLIAERAGVPLQTFHNHSDLRGGYTIGAMDEQWTGILNADLGNPILAMHSVRELGGVADHEAMIRFLKALLSDER